MARKRCLWLSKSNVCVHVFETFISLAAVSFFQAPLRPLPPRPDEIETNYIANLLY